MDLRSDTSKMTGAWSNMTGAVEDDGAWSNMTGAVEDDGAWSNMTGAVEDDGRGVVGAVLTARFCT